MHKKLAGDLTSLAHSILQMKDKEDVFALRKKAHEIYEKLSVLAYVEEYINNTPNPTKTKEELIEQIEAIEENSIGQVSKEKELEEEGDSNTNHPEHPDNQDIEDKDSVQTTESAPELFEKIEDSETELEEIKEEVIEETKKLVEEVSDELEEVQEETTQEVKEEMVSLEEELKDTLSVDVAADLFETVPKKSLNEKLHGDIQIGLNDRIAFVKNLFDGSQEDFNRVVSQLNTFKSMKEAKKFINKMVKPDYDWSNKEEFVDRFFAIVERKFA